jgi:hypothetical protein
MRSGRQTSTVSLAFEEATYRIAMEDILPLREVSATVRKSIKYAQIAASITEVGIIEPPVVVPDKLDQSKYHLLDGHLRIDILRERGDAQVVCLIATEDEAFTYNRRVSRIATIQEHKMILNAVKKGVSEERLARALNVNVASIRAKRNLLVGICPETVDLLRDRHVPLNTFHELRKLKPLRQIAAAEMMIAMNRYSMGYAKSIVAGTPEDQLITPRKRAVRGLTDEQAALMERESADLDREFKLIEHSYGAEHLDLVLATGYVARLLGNVRVVRHLAQFHANFLSEFQKIADLQMAA